MRGKVAVSPTGGPGSKPGLDEQRKRGYLSLSAASVFTFRRLIKSIEYVNKYTYHKKVNAKVGYSIFKGNEEVG